MKVGKKQTWLIQTALFIGVLIFSTSNASSQKCCKTIDYDNYSDPIKEYSYSGNGPIPDADWDYLYEHGNCLDQEPRGINSQEQDVRYIKDGNIRLAIQRLDQPVTSNDCGVTDDFIYKQGICRSLFADGCIGTYGGAYTQSNGFENGLFEFEAKMGKGHNFKSSIWLYGNGEEIDVIEYVHSWNPDVFLTNVVDHHDNGAGCGRKVVTGVDLSADFHKYSLVWTPYTITWFLDGVELTSVDRSFGHGCFYIEDIILSTRLVGPVPGDEPIVYSDEGSNDPEAYSPFLIREITVRERLDQMLPGKITYEEITLNDDNDAKSDLIINPAMDRIFYANNNNSVSTFSFEGENSWGHTNLFPTVSNVAGDLSRHSQSGKLFYKGLDQKIWVIWWNSELGDWDHNVTNNSFNNVASDVIASSSSKVFYRSTANKLNYVYKTPEGWKHRDIANVNNIKSDLNRHLSTGKMFYIGTDNNIWVAWWTPNGWLKTTIVQNADAKKSLTINQNNDALLYYVDNDDRLRKIEKVNGTWTSGLAMATSYTPALGIANDDIVVDGVGGSVIIYADKSVKYRGLDNSIYEYYQQTDDEWYWQRTNAEVHNASDNEFFGSKNGSVYYIDNNRNISVLRNLGCEDMNPPTDAECSNRCADEDGDGKPDQVNDECPGDPSIICDDHHIMFCEYFTRECSEKNGSGKRNAKSSEDKSIQLYPNPSNGNVMLSGISNSCINNIQLLSTSGIPIMKSYSVSEFEGEIALTNSRNGVYFVRITFCDNSTETLRLILVK